MKKLVFAFAVLYASSSFGAQSIALTNKVFVEIEEKKKNGKIVKKTVPATKVIPGSLLTYVISYENKGKENASNIIINNKLAKEVVFQSADDGAIVSVDGGKKFGALSQLKVKASGKLRPAKKTDVTHVRWVVSKTIKPKKKGSVKFYALLK